MERVESVVGDLGGVKGEVEFGGWRWSWWQLHGANKLTSAG